MASLKHANITAAHKVFNISILETRKGKHAISSSNKESRREKHFCFIGLIMFERKLHGTKVNLEQIKGTVQHS